MRTSIAYIFRVSTRRQNLSTTYIFANLKQFLNYRDFFEHEKSLSVVKLDINLKLHVIFGFCNKIMSFRDLAKLLDITTEIFKR